MRKMMMDKTGQRLLAALAAVLIGGPAHAYIGPGAGLGTIMVAVALVIGLALLLFGFVWYPVRRMLRNRKTASVEDKDD